MFITSSMYKEYMYSKIPGLREAMNYKPDKCVTCSCKLNSQIKEFKHTDTSNWSSNRLREETKKIINKLRNE